MIDKSIKEETLAFLFVLRGLVLSKKRDKTSRELMLSLVDKVTENIK